MFHSTLHTRNDTRAYEKSRHCFVPKYTTISYISICNSAHNIIAICILIVTLRFAAVRYSASCNYTHPIHQTAARTRETQLYFLHTTNKPPSNLRVFFCMKSKNV